MKNVSIREVRKELAQIDALLMREGEVIVTRRGKPIARLLPVRNTQNLPSHDELRARMPRLRRGSEQLVRQDRDGR
jgi:prevent-host-death family protein